MNNLILHGNEQLKQLCDIAAEDDELSNIIRQLFQHFACGYDPYDPNNKFNKLNSKYNNINMADVCNENPDICALLNLGLNEMCKLSKLSVKDFQKALCQYQNLEEDDYEPMFNMYFG